MYGNIYLLRVIVILRYGIIFAESQQERSMTGANPVTSSLYYWCPTSHNYVKATVKCILEGKRKLNHLLSHHHFFYSTFPDRIWKCFSDINISKPSLEHCSDYFSALCVESLDNQFATALALSR